MPVEPSNILVPFGFTSLESEIYAFLLKQSPATGYKVAQSIGKAAANTYKALESLQQKGAVLVDQGGNRMCRAVSSDELLSRLTRDFEWKRAEAELELSRMNRSSADERVYALRSRAQCIERARTMLGNAVQMALVVGAPSALQELSDGFAAAARSGAEVVIGSWEVLALPDVEEIMIPVNPAATMEDMRLVVDGSEMLCALFQRGTDEVIQAIWTQSPYLSITTHRGLAAELALFDRRHQYRQAESTLGFRKVFSAA